MTSDSKNRETWDSCPAGTLQSYAQKAKARHQFRAITRTTGAVAAIICVVGLSIWTAGRFSAEHEYYFGGIACGDVRANLEAYATDTLPEETADQIRIHLQECPACQELMRQMKQQERSAASLQSAEHVLLASSPNPEGHFGQLPANRPFSVAQAD